MTGLSDSFQRPINYLRVSVTDRCNLRCVYCMPPEGIQLMSHQDVLSYEEIYAIVRAAAAAGIDRVRFTGGEPLVRLGMPDLIRMVAGIKAINDIALTTNGILLPRYAAELKAAGLRRVNISLDTLKPEKFQSISRSRFQLSDILAGIEAARQAGLKPVKLNTVVLSGVNDDEIEDFAAKTIETDWHIRFIEFMPFPTHGEITSQFISMDEIRKRIEKLGKLEPAESEAGNGPAKYYRLPGAKGTIGFITPVTEHFCFQCNRLRLTADGKLRLCLLAEDEIDLRTPLRSGASLEEIKKIIIEAVQKKPLRHTMGEGKVHLDRPLCQIGG